MIKLSAFLWILYTDGCQCVLKLLQEDLELEQVRVNSLTHMVVVVDENSGDSTTAALESKLQASTHTHRCSHCTYFCWSHRLARNFIDGLIFFLNVFWVLFLSLQQNVGFLFLMENTLSLFCLCSCAVISPVSKTLLLYVCYLNFLLN